MEFLEEAEYQLWAERKFFDVLAKVSEEDWKKVLPEFNKSLQFVYIHKYKVMFAWLTLLYVKNSTKISENPLNIPDFENLSKDQFITEATKLFEMVIQYIKNNPDTKITLTIEWIKNPYQATVHGVLFNLLNHLTYHRGQTAFLFKKLGHITPDTDYNPYMYELQGLK